MISFFLSDIWIIDDWFFWIEFKDNTRKLDKLIPGNVYFIYKKKQIHMQYFMKVFYVVLRRKLGRKIIFALPHVLARQLPRILT